MKHFKQHHIPTASCKFFFAGSLFQKEHIFNFLICLRNTQQLILHPCLRYLLISHYQKEKMEAKYSSHRLCGW